MEGIESHIYKLIGIVKESGDRHEGNCITYDGTPHITPLLKTKQQNLRNLAVGKKRLLEIGFNSGFSSILLLEGSKGHLTAVDIGHHGYVRPCADYVRSVYPGCFDLIIGDSTEVVPTLSGSFDLIHVDGCHLIDVARADLENSDKLLAPGGVMIFDDTNDQALNELFNEFLRTHDNYTELEILPTQLYQHRAVQKL